MKKCMLSMGAMIVCIIAMAQNDYKKNPAIGVQFVLNDFRTAADIRSTGLAEVLKAKQWSKTSRMASGLSFSYLQGVNNYVDFAATLAGSYLDYQVPNKISDGQQKLLLEASATANLKLVTDKYWFNPFLTLGVGASKYSGYYGAFLPAGVGIQFKILDDTYLLVNSQYRIPISENVAYHFYHGFGVVQSFGKKKAPVAVVEVPVVPVVIDKDNDGVLDADDKCPDVAGLANLLGCPDRDADGIADGDDKCPELAGAAKYGGCPVPDSDGDGINDEEDKCMSEKGLARYQGCPVPDTDKDGVNDEEDRCPSRQGPVSNQGCPEIAKDVVDKINYAAKNVFFATGSAKLLAKSNKSLDEVVSLLKADESLKLSIDGHTDNSGKPEKNQLLSEARANAVKTYLTAKDIAESRLTATGYGIDKPVADNKTAAGRAKNRRVEITASNF
jgi:OmpA-OmpF porin, OOP family